MSKSRNYVLSWYQQSLQKLRTSFVIFLVILLIIRLFSAFCCNVILISSNEDFYIQLHYFYSFSLKFIYIICLWDSYIMWMRHSWHLVRKYIFIYNNINLGLYYFCVHSYDSMTRFLIKTDNSVQIENYNLSGYLDTAC